MDITFEQFERYIIATPITNAGMALLAQFDGDDYDGGSLYLKPNEVQRAVALAKMDGMVTSMVKGIKKKYG